jgi:hypothetical protein
MPEKIYLFVAAAAAALAVAFDPPLCHRQPSEHCGGETIENQAGEKIDENDENETANFRRFRPADFIAATAAAALIGSVQLSSRVKCGSFPRIC